MVVPIVKLVGRERRAAGLAMLVLTAFAAAFSASGADNASRMSQVELKHLIAAANKPADYQKLALYFHEKELFYRAKAQTEMMEYAQCVRNFMMEPKFPTRADQTARLYEYYSAKADQQAKLAARYDGLLMRGGAKPVGNSYTVSVTSFRDAETSK